MRRFVSLLDKITDITGRVFSWLVVPLTLLIVFEVVMRRIFNAPTIWSFETSLFLYGGHFMLVTAYGLLHNSHVRVTILSEKLLSPRIAVLIDLACYFLLLLPFVYVMLVYGIKYAGLSWAQHETSWSIWHPPLYPIKTAIPITAVLVLVQTVSDICKRLVFVITGREEWIR